MAAELRIHVQTDEVTEEVLRGFFSNTIGSHYFGSRSSIDFSDAYSVIADTPSFKVGDVSNLKAAVTGEQDTYVPRPSQVIQKNIGAKPTEVDDELIKEIREAKIAHNNSNYDDPDVDGVVEFLEEHRGEKVFTVSW